MTAMEDTQRDFSKLRILNWLDEAQSKIEKVLISLGMILVTAILFINIVYNFITDSTLPWASELSQYIMVWVVFIGASALMRATEHVTMDLIMRILPKKGVPYLDVFVYSVVFIFLLYLMYIGWNMTVEVYNTGQTMSTMGFSMAWVYLSFPVGMFLMAINSLKVVAIKLTKIVRGETQ